MGCRWRERHRALGWCRGPSSRDGDLRGRVPALAQGTNHLAPRLSSNRRQSPDSPCVSATRTRGIGAPRNIRGEGGDNVNSHCLCRSLRSSPGRPRREPQPDPKHWLDRAKEARALAELMDDPEAKRTMLKNADDYERRSE